MAVLDRQITTRLFVTVNGVPTDTLAASAHHGVDRPVGTGSISVPLPTADHITLNAPVEIQAGFDESAIRTIFSGRITDSQGSVNESGRQARYRCDGWASVLDFSEEAELRFSGATTLYEIFRSLCQRRNVPKYRADRVTYPSSASSVTFGGLSLVDNGDVIIPKRTSPLQWLSQKARLFGYRIFDTPSGEVRLQRISGLPPTGIPAVGVYQEAINAHAFSRNRDTAPMVTYWEVLGARWTDSDGVDVQIRSIPATVPYTAVLDPPGYRGDRVSDRDLVTVGRAAAVRNVREIDHSTPYETERWDIHGDPTRQPGDIVYVESASLGIPPNAKRWLMDLNQRVDRGYHATMEGWAGAGQALAAGEDSVAISVGTGPYHIGDETISWYASPVPQGATIPIPLTVPDDYTAIALSGKAHGSNSYFIGGTNTEATVSKLEVWQSGEKVGSADFPVMLENYEKQLDYTNLAYWQDFRMPVPGRLEAGQAEVRIVSGEEKKATGGPVDDMEVRDIVMTLSGVGQPTLPSGGG